MKKTARTVLAAALSANVLAAPALAQFGMNPSAPWMQVAPQAEQSMSYLGVYLVEVGPESVEELNLPAERGAHVKQVLADTPAEEAGLLAEDVITAWNETRVESAAQLQRLVSETPPGRTVAVELIREGDAREVRVTVGRKAGDDDGGLSFFRVEPRSVPFESWPPDAPSLGPDPFPGWRISPPRLGIEMQTLTAQLAEYFGLEDGRLGVLVAGVLEGSAAAEAGLRVGDVIVSIDGREVDSIPEVRGAVGDAGDAVEIVVMRDGREVTIRTALPRTGRERNGADDGARERAIPTDEDQAPAETDAPADPPKYPKEAM